MFSCEFCEIFKNTFFAEHLPMAVSYCPKKNHINHGSAPFQNWKVFTFFFWIIRKIVSW